MGRSAMILHAESYFGKFYGSVKGEAMIDFPSVFPLSASTYFVMNRWDYFRSFATFFEDVKPSFLVQNEMYFGLKLKHPILNNSKGVLDVRWFNLEDDYYQTQNFLSIDTTDETHLKGSLISYEMTDNTLNRKQFASEGHFFTMKIKYLTALETTVPGSTALFDSTVNKQHDWLNLNIEGQYYFLTKPHLHLGAHAKAMFNSQSLFSNYTASLLSMPTLNVIPDLETYFFKEYRSPQFIALGANLVVPIFKGLEYRFDAYYYQPFITLQQFNDGSIKYSKPFKGSTWLASTSFLYHTPFGPIRATLNYFPLQAIPLNFQVSFGYVLFNERAVR
jgi:NTE family protein